MIEAADRLREKARGYELNKLAADERGDVVLATAWTIAAITLHEVADALDPVEVEERDAA